jgi:hypothetical protein
LTAEVSARATGELTNHLTPSQAAVILGVTPLRVRQLANEGKLPTVWTPLGRLFTRADVESLKALRESL